MHHPNHSERFTAKNPDKLRPVRAFSEEDRIAGYLTRCSRQDEWSALTLRQEWADAGFMRDQIRAAGITAPNRQEPATVRRLLQLLRRAGISAAEAREAVGPYWTKADGGPLGALEVLGRFLELTPGMPLWVALARVLELGGRHPVTVTAPESPELAAPWPLLTGRTAAVHGKPNCTASQYKEKGPEACCLRA